MMCDFFKKSFTEKVSMHTEMQVQKSCYYLTKLKNLDYFHS
jgi:hypothetical protein